MYDSDHSLTFLWWPPRIDIYYGSTCPERPCLIIFKDSITTISWYETILDCIFVTHSHSQYSICLSSILIHSFDYFLKKGKQLLQSCYFGRWTHWMFAEAEYTTMSIHHSFLNRGKGCGGWGSGFVMALTRLSRYFSGKHIPPADGVTSRTEKGHCVVSGSNCEAATHSSSSIGQMLIEFIPPRINIRRTERRLASGHESAL